MTPLKWFVAFVLVITVCVVGVIWAYRTPEAIQKRNDEWQSYRDEGYRACQDGIPPEACQHQGLNRKLWMEGWQQRQREKIIK